MKFEDLTPELKEKVLSCKTPEDIKALADEQGYEMTDEQLENVAGGDFWSCDNYHPCTKHDTDWC